MKTANKKNKDRNFIKIIKEICAEEHIQAEFISHEWIVRLTKNGQVRHIFGYNFELNSSTSQMIAQDKAATMEILGMNQVPSVEHTLFLGPKYHNYFDGAGNWPAILAYAEQHDFNLICKPSRGTGGNNVFRISNQRELEEAVHDLFKSYMSICLSPFLQIENEYRVLLLDGQVQVIYSKQIDSLTGDGSSTVLELINRRLLETGTSSFDVSNLELTGRSALSIPAAGEAVKLNWKHNLAFGARPEIVAPGTMHDALAKLANQAADAIRIRFASVDIVEVDGEFFVLEINSGVMGEAFSRNSTAAYEIAKNAYRSAIEAMFKLPD